MCYKFVELVYKYDIPPTPKAVLLALAYKKNPNNGRCFPSWGTLQAMTGLSRRSVANAIVWLTNAGIIEHRRIGEGRNAITSYKIHRNWKPPELSTG